MQSLMPIKGLREREQRAVEITAIFCSPVSLLAIYEYARVALVCALTVCSVAITV